MDIYNIPTDDVRHWQGTKFSYWHTICGKLFIEQIGIAGTQLQPMRS